MTVSIEQSRLGPLVEVIATSDEVPPVWFHWWIDGVYCGATGGDGSTQSGRTFHVGLDGQERIQVIDSTSESVDPATLGADAYPARRSLWFLRSLETGVDRYRIEQQQDGGQWTIIGRLTAREDAWAYTFGSGRLDDLSDYAWRAIPIDACGNDGTPISIASQTIVRPPDAPRFEASFDVGTARVTITEPST